MQSHCGSRTTQVTIRDGIDDALVIGEAVMIPRRSIAIGAEPAPHDCAPDRVQYVEQAKQERIAARLRDLPVQQIVEVLVLPPSRGLASLHQRLPYRGNVVEGGVQRRLASDLGLQDQ